VDQVMLPADERDPAHASPPECTVQGPACTPSSATIIASIHMHPRGIERDTEPHRVRARWGTRVEEEREESPPVCTVQGPACTPSSTTIIASIHMHPRGIDSHTESHRVRARWGTGVREERDESPPACTVQGSACTPSSTTIIASIHMHPRGIDSHTESGQGRLGWTTRRASIHDQQVPGPD